MSTITNSATEECSSSSRHTVHPYRCSTGDTCVKGNLALIIAAYNGGESSIVIIYTMKQIIYIYIHIYIYYLHRRYDIYIWIRT